MKKIIALLTVINLLALTSCCMECRQQTGTTLFNGKDVSAWRSVNNTNFPSKGWKIEEDMLVIDPATGSGGDIITREQYADFELELEFRITEGANSGVKYFVANGLGLEYQILDDVRHPDAKAGKNGNRTLGSLYDLIPAAADKPVKPIGQWNTAKIVSKGMHVEHWLNGKKILEYVRNDPDFRKLVAESKYKNNPDFGLAPKGPILLQDHGNKVFYRNIIIRTPQP